jgi:hypothetical protein
MYLVYTVPVVYAYQLHQLSVAPWHAVVVAGGWIEVQQVTAASQSKSSHVWIWNTICTWSPLTSSTHWLHWLHLEPAHQ